MPLTQLIVLAVLQGATEFLPVSASAHLALLPVFTVWPGQEIPLSLAVQAGSLLAVMIYFWRDEWAMLTGLANFARGKRDPGARLAFQIVVATIPALALAYAFLVYVGDSLNTLRTIAWTTTGYALLLFVADRMCMTVKRLEHASYLDAVLIGLCQVLALVPGASRAGITITMARLLGYERAEAARVSMLLSVPAILAGGVWLGRELYRAGGAALTNDLLIAGVLSFVSGLIVIAVLMAWLRRATFTPFVIYRLLLGGVLLAVAYGWVSF